MPVPLHVSAFSGVVLEGSADQRGVDEVLLADSLDIGPRGALIATSDVTPYVVINDGAETPAPWTRCYGVFSMMPGAGFRQTLAMGEGTGRIDDSSPYGPAYFIYAFDREGDMSPLGSADDMAMLQVAASTNVPTPPTADGTICTFTSFPGLFYLPTGGGGDSQNWNFSFLNIGAREGFFPKQNGAFGLWAIGQVVDVTGILAFPISTFNALGTGVYGDGVTITDVGTNAQQLFFRGIISWNDFIFGWGFDSSDSALGDGPARIMFCNLGMPLKWGNDDVAASGARVFTDSDAIVLGDAGEIVRGAIKWNGKLWFGTNQQMHYIAGYGRDSFLTDGATPVSKAWNIVGPCGLLEGPDRMMYGVSDQGLWRTADGVSFEPIFRKLVDFDGKSNGYWDQIWTDLTRTAASYPGRTNQDLVWMVSDRDRRQVVIGIPWCDATAGYGYGTDTVVLKFHVDSNGFTRQVFPGVQYTAAAFLRREGQQRNVNLLGTATVAQDTIQYYSFVADQAASPVMPATLPVVTLGPYAPFGPDGRGQLKRLYATVAWESAASLPLVFQVTPAVDQQESDTFALTIGPTAPSMPAPNDLWLDTSETDTNIGNGTAGVLTPSFPEYLLRSWASGGFWRQLCGVGTNGLRATIRLPLNARTGTRVTMTFATLSAAGRFQWESIAEDAGGGTPAQ